MQVLYKKVFYKLKICYNRIGDAKMILEYKIKERILVKDFINQTLSHNVLKVLNQAPCSYLVNDQNVKNYYELAKGDTLRIVIPPVDTNVEPTKGELDIIYEDSYILVVNKPSNMATIPTRRYYKDSLANLVAYYYITKGINEGVHIVGRLDYATSGLVVVAKGPVITELLKSHILKKEYLVEVEGHMNDAEVYSSIVRDETSIIKRKNVEGTTAHTSFKLLEQKDTSSIMLATLHTGKTHQIRLHAQKSGHPVLGDELYGDASKNSLLHLHCYHLTIKHPITNEIIELISKSSWE